jgi:TIGR03009 family protein
MRYHWLALACVLLGSVPAWAQQAPPQPAAPPAADPAQAQLEQILLNWERAMMGIDKLVAQIVRTDTDKVYQSASVFDGSAKFMRPNRAKLKLEKRGKPEIYEELVYTGTYLYQFVPQQKEIRVHQLPAPKTGTVSDETFLSFLLPGMKATAARERYQLTLMTPPPNDTWYYYLLIQPKSAADKAEFTRARLVINRNTYMPRELWFEEPNGNESKWDFPRVQTNAPLPATEFSTPTPPAGWRMVTVPPQPPPRLVRPQQSQP